MELSEFLRGTGTARGLPVSWENGAERASPCAPTRIDMEQILCGQSRACPASDFRAIYTLPTRNGAPVKLSNVRRGQAVGSFVWLAQRCRDDAQVVVKVCPMIETPERVRTAFDLLCQFDGNVERGGTLTHDDLSLLNAVMQVMYSDADPVRGYGLVAASALSIMGCHTEEGSTAATFTMQSDVAFEYFGLTCCGIAKRLHDRLVGTVDRRTLARLFERVDLDRQHPGAARRKAHRYVNHLNSENMNETVAGSYVSFLHHAGLAPAIAPVLDYFTAPVLDDTTSSLRNSFIVSPYYAYDFTAMLRGRCAQLPMHFDRPNKENLAFMRSMLAQILVTLSSAQHVARYVHYDLHSNNVRCDVARTGMREHNNESWRYRIPVGADKEMREVRIPASDTCSFVARLIDHGRTRVDRPGSWGIDVEAARVEHTDICSSIVFDPTHDTRALAHDLTIYCIPQWIDTMRSTCAQREILSTLPAIAADICKQVVDFADVLEAMASLAAWDGWLNGAARDRYPTAHAQQPSDAVPFPKPGTFLEYAALAANKLIVNADSVRTNDFFCQRTDVGVQNTPAVILEMPFFASYMSDTDVMDNVPFVADSTAVPYYNRAENGEVIIVATHDDLAQSPPLGSPASNKRSRW